MSTLTKPITYSPFRWVVLATLFIVTGTTALALISPAPLIGAIITAPGQTLSPGEITWMTMGWFNLAVACAALGGGYLVDKLGFVKIYAGGITLIVIGWLLIGQIGDTYGGMMVIRTLQGLGTGPIMASSAAVAATRFPARERGYVTSTQGAAMSAGIGLGLFFLPKILGNHGGDWQAALVSLWPIGIVALAMTAVVAFGPKPAAVANEEISAEALAATKHALSRALRMPVTWAAIGCVVVLSWVFQAFNDLSPAYLMAPPPLGLGFADGSSLLSFAQIANFLGAFAAGFVTERFFRGRVRPGIMIGFAFGAVFGLNMLLPAATTNSGLMVVTLCVAAFFFAWVNPNALAFIARNYPSNITGKLGGFAMGIGVFGGTAGVAAGSAALHATDHYTLSIIIMSAVCATGIVVALFLRQGKADNATLVEGAVESAIGVAGRGL